MTLKPIGSNQTVLELPDGIEVLFSYRTPVAAFVPGEGYLRTEVYYSTTTSRHINKWTAGYGATVKPQEYFDRLTA